MKELNALYAQMGISPAVYAYGEAAISRLRERFEAIDQVAEYNQAKVLAAFRKNRVSATCFAASTGYGYNDDGRDKLEQVYADVFHTEAALVRPHITCGTHALTIALSANLLPGDELLSPVGLPYDTLQEVIGIRPSPCSLAEYGVTYNQVDLLPDGTFDYENIAKAINPKTKMITIQRSKGYATRPTFSVKQIGELVIFHGEADIKSREGEAVDPSGLALVAGPGVVTEDAHGGGALGFRQKGQQAGGEVHLQEEFPGGVREAAQGLGVGISVGDVGLDVKNGGAVHQIRTGDMDDRA